MKKEYDFSKDVRGKCALNTYKRRYVAADAGLGRESLYKALRPGAQPRFETVRRLLDALGVKLGAEPARHNV